MSEASQTSLPHCLQTSAALSLSSSYKTVRGCVLPASVSATLTQLLAFRCSVGVGGIPCSSIFYILTGAC